MKRAISKSKITVFFAISMFFLFFFIYSIVYAQDKEKVVMGLEECIKKALDISPEIMESKYEEDVYRAKKLQAESYAYPQIEILAAFGPSPDAKKEDILRTDKESNRINGLFGRAEVTLIQPIYTFGKIESYKEAAKRGINVSYAGTKRKRLDVILRTKEFYYSLLLAKDLRNLIHEIRDELIDSIKKAEKHIELESPWADEANLYKLRSFLGVVEKNLNEVEKGITLSKDALLTSMGLQKDIDFDIPEESLKEVNVPSDIISRAIEKTKLLNPEFIKIKEGIEARRLLIDAEKSNLYPQFFLGLKGSIAGSTNRDKIDNPYIPDYFNHATVALFLGLKWSLDFGVTEGKIKESEAEYKKLIEKKRYVDEAIPFQIRKMLTDMEEAKKNIKELDTAYKNARKWLITAILNFDIGVGDAKEIGEAATIYAQTKADYLRSVFNYNMSYANLLHVSGVEGGEL